MKIEAGARKDANNVTYTGYVKADGREAWSRGGYDTKAEALKAAKKEAAASRKAVKGRFI